MSQEIGGIIISDETKRIKTPGTRALAGALGRKRVRSSVCGGLLALGWAATIGTFERWGIWYIASPRGETIVRLRYECHDMISGQMCRHVRSVPEVMQ
jgi:hypothetical protein